MTATVEKVIYALSKYVTYGLKFLQIMLLAKYLGPEGLAIFGFAQLVALFVSFLHLGVPLSINTMLAVAKPDEVKKVESHISDGFWLLIILCSFFCIAGLVVTIYSPSLFAKFEFAKYGLLSIVMGSNLLLTQYFGNIYQTYQRFVRVALSELVMIAVVFAVILLFYSDESTLLYNFLVANGLMIFLNLFFFFYRAPFKFEFALRIEHIKTLVRLGFPMLLGTVGFYLITLSVRSFVSHFYPLHDIGLFTLGISIGNAVMLGLNAVSWTFYSTILSNTCGSVDQAVQYIKKVNAIFNTCLAITIFGGILLMPVLFYFLPQYGQFYDGIVLMILSQLFMSVSFGYSCVLTARKKQNSIAIISFTTLAGTVVLSYLVGLMKLPMLFQAAVILVGMTCYSAQICYSGARALNVEFGTALWSELFSYKILVPTFVLIAIVLLKLPHILGALPFVLVVVLMFRDIVEVWKLIFGKSQGTE